jgi:cytidylate kinase
MGSVVFPDATLKIFLTADPAERARRRYKQLIEKGISANIDALLLEICDRDARDSKRTDAPLQKCADATELDTTGMSVEEVVSRVVQSYNKRASKAP